MAAKSFLRLVAGKLQAITAVVTSAGAGNDGDLVALGSDGKLDASLLPSEALSEDSYSLATSENLAAGDFVQIWNDGGTPKLRLADNSNLREVDGYVKTASTSPAVNTIFLEGVNANQSGMTPGARQYLDTVGGVTETPLVPITDTGKIHQYLGKAISATELDFEKDDCILL